MTRLDTDSQEQLDRRVSVGIRCVKLAAGREGLETQDERETYAADAISDILTALYGPAGSYRFNQMDGTTKPCDWNEEALRNAQAMLDRAFRSYEGDAEDYTVEAE